MQLMRVRRRCRMSRKAKIYRRADGLHAYAAAAIGRYTPFRRGYRFHEWRCTAPRRHLCTEAVADVIIASASAGTRRGLQYALQVILLQRQEQAPSASFEQRPLMTVSGIVRFSAAVEIAVMVAR